MQVCLTCSDTTFLMYDNDYPLQWGLRKVGPTSRPGRRDS